MLLKFSFCCPMVSLWPSPDTGFIRKINAYGGNHNASLYDIKEYFKGRDENGRMNSKSEDDYFNALMDELRLAMQELCKAIVPKVYAYGFLK